MNKNDGRFVKGCTPNETSFKKGNIPWNKGIKGTHFSTATEFKKGHLPQNHVPMWTITMRHYKRGFNANYIKIREPNKWMPLSNFIWLKYNKFIPKGYVIHHVDGNELNDNIENLILMSRRDHFILHDIGAQGRKKHREYRNNNIIRLELEKIKEKYDKQLFEIYT